MSNSETVTHRFTDCDVRTAVVDRDGHIDMRLYKTTHIYLSKEDLLHLLKLIEETH